MGTAYDTAAVSALLDAVDNHRHTMERIGADYKTGEPIPGMDLDMARKTRNSVFAAAAAVSEATS